MIEFRRKEATIEVVIATKTGWSIVTKYTAPSEMYAVLLHGSIQDKLNGTLEQIRREAYQQGWEDHKKRKPKATWFRSWW